MLLRSRCAAALLALVLGAVPRVASAPLTVREDWYHLWDHRRDRDAPRQAFLDAYFEAFQGLHDHPASALAARVEARYPGLLDAPTEHRTAFQLLAGIHGDPCPRYCPHGNVYFLPWHRAYILVLEEGLRLTRPDVHLPYWAWESKRARRGRGGHGGGRGLPPPFRRPSRVRLPGGRIENPLRRQALYYMPEPRRTRRFGMAHQKFWAGLFLPLPSWMARRAQDAPTLAEFSSRLESPHNLIHGFTGGDMGRPRTAAFDPVFWSHHANVDRLWAAWQRRWGATGVTAAEKAMALPAPFHGWTIGDTLDHEALGYTYDALQRIPPGALRSAATRASALGATLLLGPREEVHRVDLEPDPRREGVFRGMFLGDALEGLADTLSETRIRADRLEGHALSAELESFVSRRASAAELELHARVAIPGTYEIRVFVGNPRARPSSGRSRRRGYLGSFWTFQDAPEAGAWVVDDPRRDGEAVETVPAGCHAFDHGAAAEGDGTRAHAHGHGPGGQPWVERVAVDFPRLLELTERRQPHFSFVVVDQEGHPVPASRVAVESLRLVDVKMP